MTMTFDLQAIQDNIIPHSQPGYTYAYGTAGFRTKYVTDMTLTRHAAHLTG